MDVHHTYPSNTTCFEMPYRLTITYILCQNDSYALTLKAKVFISLIFNTLSSICSIPILLLLYLLFAAKIITIFELPEFCRRSSIQLGTLRKDDRMVMSNTRRAQEAPR